MLLNLVIDIALINAPSSKLARNRITSPFGGRMLSWWMNGCTVSLGLCPTAYMSTICISDSTVGATTSLSLSMFAIPLPIVIAGAVVLASTSTALPRFPGCFATLYRNRR